MQQLTFSVSLGEAMPPKMTMRDADFGPTAAVPLLKGQRRLPLAKFH